MEYEAFDVEHEEEAIEFWGEEAAAEAMPAIIAEQEKIAELVAAEQSDDEDYGDGDNSAIDGYDYWADEHEDYPLADWGYLVANGDTRMGYWEWVRSKLAEENEDADRDNYINESMDGDHASALASAGLGTDEDYGYFGGDE